MKLHCPSCGNSVKSEDIDLAGRLAKCAMCDSVFSFADEFGSPSSSYSSGGTTRSEVGKPRNFTLDRTTTGGIENHAAMVRPAFHFPDTLHAFLEWFHAGLVRFGHNRRPMDDGPFRHDSRCGGSGDWLITPWPGT